LTQGSFAVNKSEELRYKQSNQGRTERLLPVKEHACTCISNLNIDDDAAGFTDGPSVNSPYPTPKADRVDRSSNSSIMCSCDKTLPQGSRIGRSDQLLPMRLSNGDPIVVTSSEGEYDTSLLQHVTTTGDTTSGSACPLPPRKPTQEMDTPK
jgi:hypothetical protein